MSDEPRTRPVAVELLDSPLTSPRLQFYLEHKADIARWAALKNEVREATGDALAGLREDIADRAAELHSDAIVHYDGAGSSYPRLVVRRSTWPTQDGVAIVGVGLEWTRKVDPGGKAPPYYGIRVDPRASGGKTRSELVRRAVKEHGAFTAQYVPNGRDWAAYRNMDGDPDWWRDLVAWRERVLEEFLECWALAVPVLDYAIAQDGGSDDSMA